jgi:hypothetical protein
VNIPRLRTVAATERAGVAISNYGISGVVTLDESASKTAFAPRVTGNRAAQGDDQQCAGTDAAPDSAGETWAISVPRRYLTRAGAGGLEVGRRKTWTCLPALTASDRFWPSAAAFQSAIARPDVAMDQTVLVGGGQYPQASWWNAGHSSHVPIATLLTPSTIGLGTPGCRETRRPSPRARLSSWPGAAAGSDLFSR